MKINTVNGLVDSRDLGFTLMHEHISVSSAGIPHSFYELMDRERVVANAIECLSVAKDEGVNSYVDVTTLDLGRDMEILRRVGENVDVNIIVATGIWLDIPRSILRVTPDQLAKVFIREIEQGIDSTSVKAGIIKVATSDEGVTEANEIVLRAAARACKDTGVPISTHTAALSKVGNDQVAIFEEEGVDLSKVYIGHSNDTDDLEYLSGLASKGCILGMDHLPGGRGGGLDWKQRANVIIELVRRGFQDSIGLSHDYSLSYPLRKDLEDERNDYNPDKICFISRKFIPYLIEMGLDQSQVDALNIKVAARYFG